MVNRNIIDRLGKLRRKMESLGIDYFLIPTADYHNSEYVAPYFQTRHYFSGFSGSNGTLVVGMEEGFPSGWRTACLKTAHLVLTADV